MSSAGSIEDPNTAAAPKRLGFFERYLTVWVFLCMVVGVGLGNVVPDLTPQSVCRVCNSSRRWYNTALPAS